MSLSPQVCKKSYKVKIPTLGENCEFWLITVTDESGITNPNKDHAYLTDSGKLYIYNGNTLIQVNCDICFTQEERDKLEGIEEGANKYVLPVATDNALGGIKTGFTQTEKQYAVEVTEEGQAYVTVPWTDTVYTLPVADTDTLGGVKLGYSQNGKNYPVVKDSEGNIYVAVPWEEYSLPQAETNTLGGIKTGYEQQGQYYPVLVDVDGNAYVNVPWTDTDTKYNVVSTTENGLAPMLPTENADKKFLNGDGEWVEVNESINGNTVTGSTFSGETSDCGVQILEVQGKTVQQTTNGYQLFDASKLATKSQGGATLTNNGDGSFTLTGMGNLSEIFNANYYVGNADFLKKGLLKLNLNGSMSLLFQIIGLSVKGDQSTENRTFSITNNGTVEITDEILRSTVDVIAVFYGGNGSSITSGTVKPMLYQDGDGTWEPYTGGKPAPNPDYPMEIQNVEIDKVFSSSGNMLNLNWNWEHNNVDYTITNDKTIKATVTNKSVYPMLAHVFSENELEFIKGKYITLLYDKKESSKPTSIFQAYYKNSKSLNYVNASNGKRYIPKDITQFIAQLVIINSDNLDDIEVGDYATFTAPRIIVGDLDDTSWQPYGFSAIETSLTLAEGDTYENGQVTRVRKQITFDGSSDENWYIQNTKKPYVSIACPNIKFPQYANTLTGYKCNRFEEVVENTTWSDVSAVGFSINTEKSQPIRFRYGTTTNTVEAWKTWLQSHPVTVEYELETPTTEEFKVPTIPSYKPYTEISTNSVVDPTITFRPLPFTTCLVGYNLPTASSTVLGGVKIGSNISISSGTISIDKEDVTGALGYTPPTANTTYEKVDKSSDGLCPKLPNETTTTKYLRQDGAWAVPPNTTYGVATTSSNGLMSSTDKSRLDQLWAKFDSMVFFTED